MNDLSPSELVELITEMVPDLQHADPSAKMRLRLMSMSNYIHAGYYSQCTKDEEVTLNNVNGEMSEMHISNMIETIIKHNVDIAATGYYFITHAEGYGKYNYSHYFVSKY